jgi:hypothetical protein
MLNSFSTMTKVFFITILTLVISSCGSTDETTQSSSVETHNQAALVKEQQREAKQHILDYAKADADYHALVAKFNGEEVQAIDFDAILRIYPLTTKYSPYGNVEQAQKLVAFASMEEKNWDACLHATKLILEENYTSITGHYGALACHFESGQQENGEYHNAMLDGFIDAIWRSGDGKTPATAFYITSTNDLYAFVQLNGMVAIGQSLVYYEQRPMNAIKVQDPQTKQQSTWYFEVTAQFRRGIFDDIESRR